MHKHFKCSVLILVFISHNNEDCLAVNVPCNLEGNKATQNVVLFCFVLFFGGFRFLSQRTIIKQIYCDFLRLDVLSEIMLVLLIIIVTGQCFIFLNHV